MSTFPIFVSESRKVDSWLSYYSFFSSVSLSDLFFFSFFFFFFSSSVLLLNRFVSCYIDYSILGWWRCGIPQIWRRGCVCEDARGLLGMPLFTGHSEARDWEIINALCPWCDGCCCDGRWCMLANRMRALFLLIHSFWLNLVHTCAVHFTIYLLFQACFVKSMSHGRDLFAFSRASDAGTEQVKYGRVPETWISSCWRR